MTTAGSPSTVGLLELIEDARLLSCSNPTESYNNEGADGWDPLAVIDKSGQEDP